MALLQRVVRHRVRALDRLRQHRLEAPEVELVPGVAVLGVDVEGLEVDAVRRALELHVAAGAERNLLALGECQLQLLDERGDVAVGDDLALPLADVEDLGRDLDLHVALDLDLAGEPAAAPGLAAADEARLGRQQVAAAFLDDHLADAAGALAAAGRGDEDLVVGQRLEQRAAGGRLQRLARVVVDQDRDVAVRDQLALGREQDRHQQQDHCGEHRDAGEDFVHGFLAGRPVRAGCPRTS